MLMKCERSVLLVVDVQERLAPAMHDAAAVVAQCAWLARLAVRMGVPLVVTEHCPDKIGHTVAEVKAAATGAVLVAKQCFSAQSDDRLATTAVGSREQVVLCGMEAHVCVLQTALELRAAGKAVFAVAPACSSRRPSDRELAFERLRGHGVAIVSPEMVAFEWLQRGGTELFREVHREFLR